MTTPPSATGKPAAPSQVKDEEEDLDELDDLLDQFTPAPSAVPPTTKTPAAPAAGVSGTTSEPASEKPDAFTEDFEAALAREMEAMMRGTEGAGEGSAKDMAAAWQKMLIGDLEGTNPQEDLGDIFKSLGAAPGSTLGASSSSAAQPATKAEGGGGAEEPEFQRTIRQAMDKLKSSDESAREGGNEAESFAQLLKSLGELGEGAEGDGAEGLQGMIEGMMGQLMGKEILYEPLQELDTKFPAYFDAHPELSEDDKKRYKKQQELVKKILAVFERPGYTDEDAAASKEVLELMNQMQELGSPPNEIMGEVPPGFDFGTEGGKVPDMENCIIA
ncbi:Pex19-domain-containing protein [Ceratobasidium sp. AG-I]|nr:Pex19-domain-containing protein [Ceratobasidium sp. AG-I]